MFLEELKIHLLGIPADQIVELLHQFLLHLLVTFFPVDTRHPCKATAVQLRGFMSGGPSAAALCGLYRVIAVTKV